MSVCPQHVPAAFGCSASAKMNCSRTKRNTMDFASYCRKVLYPTIQSYGFTYTDTYQRPRAMVVEYRNNEHILFAVCEGNVLHVEYIYHESDSCDYRISLNQALFYNGIRALIDKDSCEEQLDMFLISFESIPFVVDLFQYDKLNVDVRFCYRLQSSREEYLSLQRGVANNE